MLALIVILKPPLAARDVMTDNMKYLNSKYASFEL